MEREGSAQHRAAQSGRFDKHSASLKEYRLAPCRVLKLIDGISVLIGVSITFSETKCSLLVVNLIIVQM
jgi:hypothetical protein